MFGDFYRGKRVFVTGHTGFKGSWLTLWLRELGAIVHGYSDSSGTGFEASSGNGGADVRDAGALMHRLDHFQPDIIFHLAAQPLVLRSYNNPAFTFNTNVGGTVNLLESLRGWFKGRVLVVTSDKVYDTSKSGPYAENAPLGGSGDPYSLSKVGAELACKAYKNSTDLDIAVLRAGNVIGGGDWAENRIIPDCVRSLRANECIQVRNPNATRPFQYVLDCLSGYLLMGCIKEHPYAINFGPTESNSVKDLVTCFLGGWGSGSWTYGDKADAAESETLAVDISLAETLLRWEPVLMFPEAVSETAKWYRNVCEKQTDPRKEALDCLRRYCQFAEESKAVWTQNWLDDLTP